jgi:primosomal protein N' (replication factor Y)
LNLRELFEAIEKKIHCVFLLEDQRGDFRQQVFFEAIRKTFSLERSTIFLVPQMKHLERATRSLESEFRQRIFIIHSQVPPRVAFKKWLQIKQARPPAIVLGVRSAIFAPLKNLGLVIIDEESDPAYKQKNPPHYNAKDVAIKRANLQRAVVLLSSTAASVESYHYARIGKFKLLRMPPRGLKIPQTRIVDISGQSKFRAKTLVSRPLESYIAAALSRRGKTILFVNRRGFSSSAGCKACGFYFRCPNCSVALHFHFERKALLCHYCSYNQSVPHLCPNCQTEYVRYFGVGTEKIESQISHLFPGAEVFRLDTDSIKRIKKEKLRSCIAAADILVVTQAALPELESIRADLICILDIDTILNLPDFRAAEKAIYTVWQLMRCLNLEDGKFVIQTRIPSHYVIQAAQNYNYQEFFEKELEFRRQLKLPPYNHLVVVTIRGKDEAAVKEIGLEFSKRIKRIKKVKAFRISGPWQAIPFKVRGNFRYNLLLAAKDPRGLVRLLEQALEKLKRPGGIIIAVDVDPA